MPLFELYRRAKEKLNSCQEKTTSCSTDLSFIPENDFVELVWENGQVMMQGQSSRSKKNHLGHASPLFTFTSQSPEPSDKDAGNVGEARTSKKFGKEDPAQNEFPMSVPSGDMGLRQDEDIVPWLSCLINESPHNEDCCDYLPEFSCGPANELLHPYYFNFVQKGSCNQEAYKDCHANAVTDAIGLEHRNATLAPSSGCGANSMNAESSSLRPGPADNMGSSTSNITENSNSGDSASLPQLVVGSPSKKVQAEGSSMSAKSSNSINFSHFARPFAHSQSNAQNNGANARVGLSAIEKGVNGSSANNGSAANSDIVKASASLVRETTSCQLLAEQLIVSPKPSKAKKVEEPCYSKHLGANCRNDASRKGKCANQSSCASTNRASAGNEKIIEQPAAAASSVCSGNSVERASDGPTCNLKRKSCGTDESEAHTEDVEEDSVGAMKTAPARGTNSKRSRAAEVHNLSERRRRDRINEKMRALQELIPNCNKADKASMLDEAIEYLKTLQLQVQMMSMAAGLYMSPMMLQMGMQQMHPSQIAQFSPMGIGMGLGMGLVGMNGGVPLPSPLMDRANALPGTAAGNFPVFGLPGQGHHVSMPCASFVPFPGVPLSKLGTGLNVFGTSGTMENMDTALNSGSKESMQSTNGASCLTNHTSTEFQAGHSNFERMILPKNTCLAMDIHSGRVADSVGENGGLAREASG